MSPTKRPLKLPVEPEGSKKNNNKNPRARHLLKKYGITEDDYQALLQKQKGLCGCCGRSATLFRQRLSVDHDHKTGEIRGLLCIFCNRYVIGRYRRSDGTTILQKAIAYLTNEYPGWIVPPKIKKKRKKRRRK